MSNCLVCKSIINSNRRGIKYCSNACKQRAYYDRKHGVPEARLLRPIKEFRMIKEFGDEFDSLTYLEYSYILSQYPHIIAIKDQVELLLSVFEHVYQYNDETRDLHLKGLLEFQKKIQSTSLDRVGR